MFVSVNSVQILSAAKGYLGTGTGTGPGTDPGTGTGAGTGSGTRWLCVWPIGPYELRVLAGTGP